MADVAVVDVEAEEVAATDVGGGGEASGSAVLDLRDGEITQLVTMVDAVGGTKEQSNRQRMKARWTRESGADDDIVWERTN